MESVQPARVLIVDDQALMREGLHTLLDLEPTVEVVGTAACGVDAVAQVAALRPDVVLMDIRMPIMDGIEATRAVKGRFPDVQVLVLTTFDDDESIFAALQAGASGYVLKDTPSEQLARDIQVVRAGEASLSPSVARKLITEVIDRGTGSSQPGVDGHPGTASPAGHPAQRAPGTGPTAPDRIDEEGRERLSDRELDVLRLAAQGLSNREIGARLYITEGTVKNHISSLLSKLQLRDRTQAVLFAKEHGLI
jgi:DNA-binding NarL/FixJ family response regulator